MKAILLLFAALAAMPAIAQTTQTKLVFNHIGGRIICSPIPRGQLLPDQGSVEITLQGSWDANCTILLGQHKIPCHNAPENNPLIVQADGSIAETTLNVTRPFTVWLAEASLISDPILIPGMSQAPVAPPTATLTQLSIKKKVATAQACVDAGPVLLWKDALDLQKAILDTNFLLIKVILGKYYWPDSSCTACVQRPYIDLHQDITRDSNHFLLQVLPPKDAEGLPLVVERGSVVEAQAGTNEGGISPPSILLNAIGSFIAKRLIDELNRAYLDKFRAKLNSPELADFRAILPQTKNFVTAIGQDNTIDYKSLLSGIRNNLFEDLSNLTLNAPQLLRNHRDSIIKYSGSELYVTGLAMLEAVNALQQKADAAEVLSRLGQYDYEQGSTIQSNTLTVLHLVANISNHLRLNDPYGPWVDLSKTFQNPRTVFLFAGLMYKADRDLFQRDSLNIGGRWQSLDSLIQHRNHQKVVELIHQVLGLIADINQLPKQTEGTETDRFLALNERLLSFAAHCATGNNLQPAFHQALTILQSIIRIKGHIVDKNFVAAGTLVFDVVEQLGAHATRLDTLSKKEFFRYLSFAQNLLDAKDEKQMVAALEQAADPVGSFRLKRQHPMTASITSYPGLFIGHEKYKAGINNKTMFNNFGFTAPLGLAISFSCQDRGPGIRDYPGGESAEPKTSWTLYMPVLDVGAITAFRLLDADAELPESSWANFLAPGLFLNCGFKNSLLTLHGGFQIGPEARKIGSDLKPRLWRFGLGISADLHLWSIYTKPE